LSLHEAHMREAFALARRARAHGNRPFGALLVAGNGAVLAAAENSQLTDEQVLAHAEMNLLRRVSRELTPDVLASSTLYTSAEPCAMCAGAIFWSGVGGLESEAEALFCRWRILTSDIIENQENAVLISPDLAKAFNTQIGHEFGAGLQYLSIAAYFNQRQLTLLSKLFQDQAEEENQHAKKFIKYLQDTKGGLHIPAIAAPRAAFGSAEEAVQAALNWEKDVTRQITALMEIAVKESDYLAQSFLQWFIDEQLEEVVKMDRMLSVIKQSGEKNLLMVEAYLVHIEKAH